MQNKARVMLIPIMLAAGQVHAEGTIGDLSQIQSETVLLKARVNRAVAQSELNARNRDDIGSASVDVPVVKAVYGIGNKLYATFQYSSGASMDAKQGDFILGGFKVASVSVEKVELIQGKKRLQVGFSANVPMQAQTSSSAQMYGSSYMPPIVHSPFAR